jgi:hypothetical protein
LESWWFGMVIVVKIGDYESLSMSEELFWNRVENLRRAMLEAEDMQFRILWYWKMQEMMKNVP